MQTEDSPSADADLTNARSQRLHARCKSECDRLWIPSSVADVIGEKGMSDGCKYTSVEPLESEESDSGACVPDEAEHCGYQPGRCLMVHWGENVCLW